MNKQEWCRCEDCVRHRRIRALEMALHGLCGFVNAGYHESLPKSYRETLESLAKDAEKLLDKVTP